jgi:MSHA pilin protein MshD
LVVFIVIVGIAVAGVLAALNVSTRASADPMTQKQALAVAEAVLEEIELRPFTFCDPDDANAATATSTAGCATTVEALGPEGETRTGVTPFDNVNDYANGFALTGISDITGTAITGLESYNATVNITPQALGGIAATDAGGAPQSLLVTVTVTGPANVSVRLDGYRARYAPNALP